MNNVELARTSRLIALVLIASSALWVGSHLLDSHPTRGANAEGVPAPARSLTRSPAKNHARWQRQLPVATTAFPGPARRSPARPTPRRRTPSSSAFPHLKFDFPVVLVPAKGTNRLFVGELEGRDRLLSRTTPAASKADLALDLAKLHPDLTAFYGLTFHPQFDENRYVYVCYVLKNDLPDGSVVSRFDGEPDRSAGDRSRPASR